MKELTPARPTPARPQCVKCQELTPARFFERGQPAGIFCRRSVPPSRIARTIHDSRAALPDRTGEKFKIAPTSRRRLPRLGAERRGATWIYFRHRSLFIGQHSAFHAAVMHEMNWAGPLTPPKPTAAAPADQRASWAGPWLCRGYVRIRGMLAPKRTYRRPSCAAASLEGVLPKS